MRAFNSRIDRSCFCFFLLDIAFIRWDYDKTEYAIANSNRWFDSPRSGRLLHNQNQAKRREQKKRTRELSANLPLNSIFWWMQVYVLWNNFLRTIHFSNDAIIFTTGFCISSVFGCLFYFRLLLNNSVYQTTSSLSQKAPFMAGQIF